MRGVKITRFLFTWCFSNSLKIFFWTCFSNLSFFTDKTIMSQLKRGGISFLSFSPLLLLSLPFSKCWEPSEDMNYLNITLSFSHYWELSYSHQLNSCMLFLSQFFLYIYFLTKKINTTLSLIKNTNMKVIIKSFIIILMFVL